MRTTVVHRRSAARPADITMPCSRSFAAVSAHARPTLRPLAGATLPSRLEPWSTAKLGLVVSTLAAIVALVIDATTSLPPQTIVLTVMVVAFGLSLHATGRRPLRRR